MRLHPVWDQLPLEAQIARCTPALASCGYSRLRGLRFRVYGETSQSITSCLHSLTVAHARVDSVKQGRRHGDAERNDRHGDVARKPEHVLLREHERQAVTLNPAGRRGPPWRQG